MTPPTPSEGEAMLALADDEADADLASALHQFTNLIMNERVRSYNEGFDAGSKAALSPDTPREGER